MPLQLTRPLAFIDLETTGVNLAIDRIVEIAIVKISNDGTRLVKRKLINPLIPIPKASSDIHGITNEMVKDAQLSNRLRMNTSNSWRTATWQGTIQTDSTCPC